jgi:hypothetical protein
MNIAALLVLLVQIKIFWRILKIVCINIDMKYAYQIQGALENNQQEILGFRVVVVTEYNFYLVDAPVELFDKEVMAYIKFRFKLNPKLNMQTLPPTVKLKIRAPLGRFLDFWVLENINGNHSERKNINT